MDRIEGRKTAFPYSTFSCFAAFEGAGNRVYPRNILRLAGEGEEDGGIKTAVTLKGVGPRPPRNLRRLSDEIR